MNTSGFGADCCLATVVSDQFTFGAAALIGSFRQSNPGFLGGVVVLWNEVYSPLSLENQEFIRKIEPGVVFRHVDDRLFRRVFSFAEKVVQTPVRLRPAFMILDAFQIPGVKRVVALDSDMLVIGRLQTLFELPLDFGIVRATDDGARPLPYFNTGTMVIGEKYLKGTFVEELESTLEGARFDRRYGKADQSVLNLYFYEREKIYLDPRYNFSKRNTQDSLEDPLNTLDAEDVRVLHFLGEKPWNIKVQPKERRYRTVERLWEAKFFEICGAQGRSALQQHLRRQEDLREKTLVDMDGKSDEDVQSELAARLTASAYGVEPARGGVPEEGLE